MKILSNKLFNSGDTEDLKEKPIKPFCLFCRKFQSQFAKHILQHHEEKWIKIFMEEQDKKQKARILSFIRNKGSGLLENITGKIKPVKRMREGVKTLKVKCEMCEGRFSKDTLWKHKKYCYGNDIK